MATLVALLAVTTGCSGRTADPPRGLTHGRGVLVRIDTAGGLTAVPPLYRNPPDVSIYADGTDVVDDSDPDSALPRFERGRVDVARVRRLVDRAWRQGLLDGDLAVGDPTITDAPTTTVEVGRVRLSVYALGLDDDVGGIDGVEAANRRRLRSFVTAVERLATSRARAPYTAAEVAVLVGPPVEVETGPHVIDWPIDHVDLAHAGRPLDGPDPPDDLRCFVTTGTDARSVLDAAEEQQGLSRWRDDSSYYSVWVRPLLPDERGCSAIS